VSPRTAQLLFVAALAAMIVPRPGVAQAVGFTSCLDRGGAPTRAVGRKPQPAETPARAEPEVPNELELSIRQFEEEAKEFRNEAQSLLEKRYNERRDFLAENYERAIRNLEVHERKERQDAIAKFEEFLSRYPNDPDTTPDAMFRLAELHYERANDDHVLAMVRWRDLAKKAAAEGRDPPPEVLKDYSRSIALYQKLITGFPKYKFQHGIMYLLAYCLGEMGQGEEAQRVYTDLIQKYPKSPFVPEAWVRLGDWHFDEVKADSLEKAAHAFSQMYAYPDHPLYARAIYKLGWTYYRVDDFQRAVESFTKLLDFYVAQSKKTGKPSAGGDVWPEAVQYTAISFADERWGGVERARAFYAALGGRPYEAEVYMRLGDVYYDETKHAQAVAAYKLVLARDPLSADAPKVQARIVQAWSRDRQFDKEAEEREVLVAKYGEGSAWWEKHKGDPDLINDVRELSEKSLTRAASFHHAQAQAFKQQGRLELAVPEYRVGARVYGDYLARFPHSKNAYEIAYNYADCLYNSLEFEKAARVYAQVRDDPADRKYETESALSAIISWEGEATRLERTGQIPTRKVILAKDRKQGEKIVAEPIPRPLQGLVRESDVFLARLPDNPKAPAIAYKAGEVFYRFGAYDEARCRFEDLVARYPQSQEASYAANLIIESHLAMKDWAAVERASARLQTLKIGKNPELASTLQKFKLGGRFNRAMELMEAKKYDEAARLFTALVNEDPKHEFADKALYNAASCYEHSRRFESALRLYERIHNDYPKSTFADDSLFRVAWNAENTYDFDKAVDRYLQLVEKYPNSKQRKDALYNAARSLENLQRYDEAARTFAQYAKLYPGADDAARTQFHAALIYEKKKDWRREVQALQEFDARFSRSREHELLVQSRLKAGLAYRELGQDKQAKVAYQAAVTEFARRGLRPEANPVGAAAAAEARFRLAEYEFERFDRISLPATTDPKKLKAALSAKLVELKKVAPAYNDVKRYKRSEWTIAAFYRQAYLLERLAQTLYDAPVPPEFKRKGQEEYLAAYQDQLALVAQPYEDQAVEVYIQAIKAARELHVKNEWTKKISESLARYRPKEYPILKEAKGRMSTADVSAAPLVDTPEGPRKRPAKAADEEGSSAAPSASPESANAAGSEVAK
jgi:TolA-binding protein